MKEESNQPSPPPVRTHRDRKRHWYRITGLSGRERSKLGVPAFGQTNCAADQADAKQNSVSARQGATSRLSIIRHELLAHVPFTTLGTLTGIVLLLVLLLSHTPRSVSTTLFWTLHPLHVLLSAMVTTAMFWRHGGHGFWASMAIGYFGAIGIATLSDCLLPFAGEWLLDLPNRGLHLGFIEKWWLVNPLAAGGILAGFAWPHTKLPHAGHVLLSTWASLFHITMALGTAVSLMGGVLIALFLFLSVWLPCCTSDIVFPLLFIPDSKTKCAAHQAQSKFNYENCHSN